MTEMSPEEVMAMEPGQKYSDEVEFDGTDCSRRSMSSRVYLGGGSFYGAEKFMREVFQKKKPGSIRNTEIGFMNRNPQNKIGIPTPTQLYQGGTNFVQVLKVDFCHPEENFEEIIRFFFQFHDPTMYEEQGADRERQFSSFVFCTDIEQAKIAARVKAELQSLIDSQIVVCFQNELILTKVCMATQFISVPRMYLPIKTPLLEHIWNTNQHRLYMEKWPTECYWYEDTDMMSSFAQKLTSACTCRMSWTALTTEIAQ